MKGLFIIAIIIMIAQVSSCQNKLYAPDYDFDLFKGTKAYYLAKAVEIEDTVAITRFVIRDQVPVDFQDAKFGNSLLSLSIHNNKTLATKKLLDLGANPNLTAMDGTSPFTQACFWSKDLNNSNEILTSLIKHGANVNAVIHDTTYNQYGKRKNMKIAVLQEACANGTLDCIKILVENGAALFYDFSDSTEDSSIVTKAMLSSNLEAVKYFLIEKKLPVPDFCVIRQPGTDHEKKMTITDLLIEDHYDGYPKQQKLRSEILEFLKSNNKK